MNYSGDISDICEQTAKLYLIRAIKWRLWMSPAHRGGDRMAPPLQCTCWLLNPVHTG